MQSMTGYGLAEGLYKNYQVSASLRVVNSKYFDYYLKIPPFLFSLENNIKKLLQSKLRRGKATLLLNVTSIAVKGLAIDLPRAAQYAKQLHTLSAENNLDPVIDVRTLLTLPEVITSPDQLKDNDIDNLAPGIIKIINQAIKKVIHMREIEGKNTLTDINRQLTLIQKHIKSIKKIIPSMENKLKKKLTDCVKTSGLIPADEHIAQKIAAELTFYLEKTNVTEEIVRFDSHIEQFNRIVKDKQVGRKLEFLLQEMLREINTLAAKGNNHVISRHVVEVKTAIDSLKEQVLNIV